MIGKRKKTRPKIGKKSRGLSWIFLAKLVAGGGATGHGKVEGGKRDRSLYLSSKGLSTLISNKCGEGEVGYDLKKSRGMMNRACHLGWRALGGGGSFL